MYYILDEDKNPIKVDSAIDWGEWRSKDENTRVRLTNVRHRNFSVSTVFLGMDQDSCSLLKKEDLPNDYKPLVFETLVQSDDEWDEFMWKYRTWEEAEMGHVMIIKAIMRSKVEFKNHRFYYL